jgi:hypothetical protein
MVVGRRVKSGALRKVIQWLVDDAAALPVTDCRLDSRRIAETPKDGEERRLTLPDAQFQGGRRKRTGRNDDQN